ncbi:hypothetical protein GCM10025876_21770 [Demequina litorisediminis]|uniref:ABC transporter domain-containing protein n=1 Tax=Demequina litorisediminis TaxID=1849022 RepID=A0ABQ6IGW1_9MICO|nr:hypothetical protein GCM10025876_21770 [Demequina litorisediminis]
MRAVDNATLTVQAGSVTALIGPNGCGKTTLMLMLAGLLRPNEGTISVGGNDPRTDAAAVRGSIGWMPDQAGLVGQPHLPADADPDRPGVPHPQGRVPRPG